MTVGIDLKNIWLYGKGIGAFTLNLLHDLAGSDLHQEITIQLYAPSFEIPELKFLNQHKRFSLITTYPFDKKSRLQKVYYDQFGLLRYLRKHKPDLFYSPYFDIPFGWQQKLITTVHDLSILEQKENYGRAFHRYYSVLLHKSIRQSTHIITVSDNSAAKLKEVFRLPDEKIRIIYNKAPKQFLNCDNSLPDTNELRKKHALPKAFLLYTGGIEARKNIGLLLDGVVAARKKNPEIPPLVVTGITAEKRLGEFRELFHNKGLIVLDYLPYEEIVALYRMASLIVNTSSYEGFGMPVLEALTVQAPILCTDIPVYREIGKEYAHYFRNNDQADFEQQLCDFFSGKLPALQPQKMQEQADFFNQKNYASLFFNMINHAL